MMISTTVNSTVSDICIRIPQHYHRQPIISRLISSYDLTVNIAAALLKVDSIDDGWFNLEIQGSFQQVEAGIAYLQKLDIEIEQLNFKILGKEGIDISDRCSRFQSSPQIQDNQAKFDWSLIQKQTNRAKFHVCISKHYRYSPVIAGLVSFGLTVNIVGASLNTNTKDDGWFDLEIWGNPQQIVFGLRYLKQLGLQIWL
ncbi:NIL domain-containing protein [Nostoc sp. MG11]|uniref:NIL domain-containing protein n=1 Tax=Nostoc sp. MG11 TaxID=2721166 RepID=UPI001865C88D|nr:NIL domain-containing protein [Nostoc sp. MG11]